MSYRARTSYAEEELAKTPYSQKELERKEIEWCFREAAGYLFGTTMALTFAVAACATGVKIAVEARDIPVALFGFAAIGLAMTRPIVETFQAETQHCLYVSGREIVRSVQNAFGCLRKLLPVMVIVPAMMGALS